MNESQIFANALKFAIPAERAAYLDEACAGNPQLRADVKALLEAHVADPGFLEQPVAPIEGTVDCPPSAPAGTEQPGVVLAGRYKLLEAIGEGGMGTVWMAQQTEPVKRLVAVKLIKPGMDSQQVLARFEAERQALALMDHPHIAKVHDAGAATDGRPFFVMELVKGVPITDFCDQRRLTPPQRLELFVAVCQAIQHAHQKGIIHRDLKPSNVLVALYDDQPVVKVIDFGVAKATGEQLTEQSLHTGFGAVVGTVEYMSPEQATFNQLDVDTRSDLYSLGVVLYELLTGTTPLEHQRVKETGILEALRLIREEEAPTLSNRLITTKELPAIAARRGVEPARLTRLVRGELDWIVMKALEKDRNRRYESANSFAADVQRYLADEPVQARPPSAGYRLWKFVRRKKGVLTAVVAVSMLALLLAGSVGWFVRDREARQAEATRESREFLKQARQLVGEDRLSEARQELASAKARIGSDAVRLPHLLAEIDALEAALQRYQSFFHLIDQAYEAEVLYSISSEVRLSQKLEGDLSKSAGLLLEALSLYGVMEGKASNLQQEHSSLQAHQVSRLRRNFYEALVWLANDTVLRQQDHRSGRDLSQQEAAQQALVYLHKAEVIFPPTSIFYHIRGLARIKLGQREAGQADLKLARESRATLALDHNLLGSAAYWARNKSEAVQHHLAALRVEATHYWTLMRLGYALCDLGENEQDYTAAVAVFTGCILKRPKHVHAYFCRGIAFQHLGRFDEALTDYTKAIELNPNNFWHWYNRGNAYRKLNLPRKALPDYTKAVELEPKFAQAWYNRGNAYVELGQPQKAVADYTKAIELEPKFAQAWYNRGYAYRKLNLPQKALPDYTKAIELEPKFAQAWCNRGNAYRKLNLPQKALPDYTKAIELEPKLASAWCNRGNAYLELGQPQKAVADYTKAIELEANNAGIWLDRGTAYLRLDQVQKAVADYRKAIEINPNYAEAHGALAIALAQQRKTDEAVVAIRKALEIDPNTALNHFYLGFVLSQKGLCKEAITAYGEAVRLKPDDPSTLSNLASLLATCPDENLRDPARAVELAEKALTLAPGEGHIWTDLGQAKYRAGDWKGAIEALQKAIELNKRWRFSEKGFFLAMAHWQLGHKDQARQWHKEAVEWMDKNRPDWVAEALRRYRAEAEELMGIGKQNSDGGNRKAKSNNGADA
jgi:tetratricopeptide (TPR) repeat protein